MYETEISLASKPRQQSQLAKVGNGNVHGDFSKTWSNCKWCQTWSRWIQWLVSRWAMQLPKNYVEFCLMFDFFCSIELLLNYKHVSKKIRIKFGWVHWPGQVHVVIGKKLWHFLKWLNDKGTNPLWWPLVLLLRPAKRPKNGSMHWSSLKSWATLNLLQVWIWLDIFMFIFQRFIPFLGFAVDVCLQKSPPCNENCSNLFPTGQPINPRPCKYSTEYNHLCCNHQCLWKGWAMATVVGFFHYFASHLDRKKM